MPFTDMLHSPKHGFYNEPVVLLKSTLLGGSWIKTGPDVSLLAETGLAVWRRRVRRGQRVMVRGLNPTILPRRRLRTGA